MKRLLPALLAGLCATSALAATEDCKTTSTSYARFWELDKTSDCGLFNLRGYKPVSVAWAHADRVNTGPDSDSDGRAAPHTAYQESELRLQLSVRSKLATQIFSRWLPWLPEDERRNAHDSLWFGYTQQSYWQIFNGEISRPFRATDHEPEIIYIAPMQLALPGGWVWRYSGLSVNHMSNGQSLPLSRSWNRVIYMAGFDKGNRYRLGFRIWERVADGVDSNDIPVSQDDNPDIEDTYGRAELTASWRATSRSDLVLTWRTPITAPMGSWRLEWFTELNKKNPGLRLHVQVFNGWGDAITDYNFRRTMVGVGVSLVDW